MTPAEKVLWKYLRGNQFGWFKFRRQFWIGPYILDFYCHERQLCIEVDGETHTSQESKEYDRVRTEYITSRWITVVRYTNVEVYENIDGVISAIHKVLL
jgi:very-short-patch-repair endonuclease